MPVSVWGNMSAAPAPWNTRAATSTAGVGARPQATDASVKVATPATKTFR
jgi:hypothetical protein